MKHPIGYATNRDKAALLAECGYDYLETSLHALAELTEEEFARQTAQIAASGLQVPVVNGFFGAGFAFGGPGYDREQNRAYLRLVCERMQRLGVTTAVLGSGAARRLDEAYGLERGRAQFEQLVGDALTALEPAGIRLGLEVLCAKETNYLTRVSEALELVRLVDHPLLGIVWDLYHTEQMGEKPQLSADADKLFHVHISNPVTRVMPTGDDRIDYAGFARLLDGLGYAGRVSIECTTPPEAAALRGCLKRLREAGL